MALPRATENYHCSPNQHAFYPRKDGLLYSSVSLCGRLVATISAIVRHRSASMRSTGPKRSILAKAISYWTPVRLTARHPNNHATVSYPAEVL